jgi:uncharacterized protein YcbK (DUF882 family)
LLKGPPSETEAETMFPVIMTLAMLLSNATDLAKLLVDPEPARAPLTFSFMNRQETETFDLLDRDGAVRADTLKAFSHFVRCWRTEREKAMHPRTVEIVTRVAAQFHVDHIEVVSGYRARPYGAPHSKHFLGRAMDIHVPGVKAKKVAAWVWKNFRHVGVGYYPKQDFVHIDTREDDVRWVDTAAHGESAHAHYTVRNPGEQLPADAPILAYDSPPPTKAAAARATPEVADLQLALAQSDVR